MRVPAHSAGQCTCTTRPKGRSKTSFELDRYKAGPHGLASHAAGVMVIVMVIVGAVIEFASACSYYCLPYMRILLSRDMQLASRHVNKRVHHALSSVPSQWLSHSLFGIKCDRAAVAWRRRHEEAATRASYQQLVPDRL